MDQAVEEVQGYDNDASKYNVRLIVMQLLIIMFMLSQRSSTITAKLFTRRAMVK